MIATALMGSDPRVELLTVTVFAALVVCSGTEPKASDVGETETTAPVPVRLTVRGLPEALSVTRSVPGRLLWRRP